MKSEKMKHTIADAIQSVLHTCRVHDLYGRHNASNRQILLSIIQGQKLPKSKCGVKALTEACYELYEIPSEGYCVAARKNMLEAAIKKYAATPGPVINIKES
jgi:hypothetical protein